MWALGSVTLIENIKRIEMKPSSMCLSTVYITCAWRLDYPVSVGQQLPAGSRQHRQQLLERHEGFSEVKREFQAWYVPDVRQEGSVVVGVVPAETNGELRRLLRKKGKTVSAWPSVAKFVKRFDFLFFSFIISLQSHDKSRWLKWDVREEVLTSSKTEPRGNSNGESTGCLPRSTLPAQPETHCQTQEGRAHVSLWTSVRWRVGTARCTAAHTVPWPPSNTHLRSFPQKLWVQKQESFQQQQQLIPTLIFFFFLPRDS